MLKEEQIVRFALKNKIMNNFRNIWDIKSASKKKITQHAFDYLVGGADDLRTFNRNIEAYQHFQIRPRRLIDVKNVDTSIELFGERYASPIFLAPVGFQELFHLEGEVPAVKAAAAKNILSIASTVTSKSFTEICAAVYTPPWFQLYTTSDRATTIRLLDQAKENNCKTIVLTIDVPVPGNREKHIDVLTGHMRDENTLGNFENGGADFDATLTWDFIPWFRENYDMNLLLKGIMTAEDAAIALDYEVDGIIVSNHGGRQLESDLSTIEVLEEISKAINGAIPILIDGGIRRGTDIFKALALGATAVGIGRPYIYGLAADGQAGVEMVLDILQTELVRNMQLAGATSVSEINIKQVREKRF